MKDLTLTTGLLGSLPPSETLGSLVKSIELQKQGVEVFLLSVGEPDFDTPRAIKEACGDLVLKVIIEACLLSDEEKARACRDAEKAGADFVKTSTGFSTGGATVEDVKLMRASVSENVRVKAAGGIRDKETFEAMIKAGAERIGTSSGKKLIG